MGSKTLVETPATAFSAEDDHLCRPSIFFLKKISGSRWLASRLNKIKLGVQIGEPIFSLIRSVIQNLVWLLTEDQEDRTQSGGTDKGVFYDRDFFFFRVSCIQDMRRRVVFFFFLVGTLGMRGVFVSVAAMANGVPAHYRGFLLY